MSVISISSTISRAAEPTEAHPSFDDTRDDGTKHREISIPYTNPDGKEIHVVTRTGIVYTDQPIRATHVVISMHGPFVSESKSIADWMKDTDAWMIENFGKADQEPVDEAEA